MISCTFEHGNNAFLRHVTADVVAHDGSDRVLLVRRAKHLGEGGKWALPGGYSDRDEYVIDGARRELLEETGYEAEELTLLRVSSDPDRPGDDRQNVTFIFFAQVGNQVGVPDLESDELGWFALDGLPPQTEVAFDHYGHLEFWKRYLSGQVTIPEIR